MTQSLGFLEVPMFDIAWSEWLFILVLALILLGPKEMASVLRTTGRWVGQIRRLAQEFYQQIDNLEKKRDE
jgi:sec-independent protein translocase protein TatB